MAKQDKVESTGGSDAAEPFDATDELSADQPVAAEAGNDLNDPVVAEPESPAVAELDDPEPSDPVDEFDEIVRHSGVGESDEDAAEGETAEPTGNGAAKLLQPASATTANRAGSASRAPARTPKAAATAKRDQPVKRERTTPLKFVRQSVGELRKVVYPTSQQLINYFIVVLVFVLFVIAYVSLLDLGLGAAIFRIFS